MKSTRQKINTVEHGSTPAADLADAIRENDIEKVKSLLSNGVGANEVVKDSKPPLFIAAYYGREEIVKLLLEHGANINEKTNMGIPYEAAYYRRQEKVLDILIGNGSCLASAQQPFITVMEGLGYAEFGGLCHGLSHMAKHAILANDITSFDKRILEINRIFLKARFDAMRELGLEKKFSKKAEKRIEKLTREKIKEKFTSYNIKTSAKEEALEEKGLKIGELISKKEKRALDKLIEKKIREKTDLLAFFDGLEVYQEMGDRRQYLYEESAKTFLEKDLKGFNLIMPIALSQEGQEPDFVGSFTGAYLDIKELTIYCDAIKQKIYEWGVEYPVAFTLSAMRHTITIGYNPRSKMWTYFDANYPPSKQVESVEEMAILIQEGFVKSPSIFATAIYCLKLDGNKMEQVMFDLKQDINWQKIHKSTPQKAKLSDALDKGTWEEIAIRYGDVEALKDIHRSQSLLRRALDGSRIREDKVQDAEFNRYVKKVERENIPSEKTKKEIYKKQANKNPAKVKHVSDALGVNISSNRDTFYIRSSAKNDGQFIEKDTTKVKIKPK